jgi:hypothetical protein
MKKRSFLSTLFVALLFGAAIALTFGDVAGAIVTAATAGTYFLPMPAGVLGMNNTNNYSARESFRVARDLLTNAFLDKFKGDVAACKNWVNSRKLSQSEIRLEVELNATSNTFVFGLTSNQNNSNGVQFNTENRLTMQDSLICYEYGIFVGNPSSRTDTTWQLKTYGSQPTFAAAAANALNSTFYSHGYFRITANNDVVMPYRGLFNHWYRPQTQQTAAFGAASPEDQIQGSEDGMITNEPNIFLIGSKGYLPQIVLPVNLASVDAFERAVVIFRGVLAQNSTDVS